MAVTPHKLQGYKAQLGIGATGSAVIVAGLKDLEGSFKAEELDSTDHSSGGWKSRMPGLLDFEGSAKFDYITGDASLASLRSAIFNSAILTIELYPEQVTGEEAYSGTCMVSDFKWDGKMSSLQSASFTLKGAGPFTIITQ